MNIHWKDWCWSWSSNILATWFKQLIHWKRPWCWERLKMGEKGDYRGWDDWMASPTRWTWVWASSQSWWRTGKPGMLQSMGSHRVEHEWVTELNWLKKPPCSASFLPRPSLMHHWHFYFLHNFTLLRMSYTWNHTVCSLFRSTSFSY